MFVRNADGKIDGKNDVNNQFSFIANLIISKHYIILLFTLPYMEKMHFELQFV